MLTVTQFWSLIATSLISSLIGATVWGIVGYTMMKALKNTNECQEHCPVYRDWKKNEKKEDKEHGNDGISNKS